MGKFSMCLLRGHNSKLYLLEFDLERKSWPEQEVFLLMSSIITWKCQFRSFLFASNRLDYNIETRKYQQRPWTSAWPWLRFTFCQDPWLQQANLASSLVAVVENIPRGWKISSFRSPHPLSSKKIHSPYFFIFKPLWLSLLVKETCLRCQLLT